MLKTHASGNYTDFFARSQCLFPEFPDTAGCEIPETPEVPNRLLLAPLRGFLVEECVFVVDSRNAEHNNRLPVSAVGTKSPVFTVQVIWVDELGSLRFPQFPEEVGCLFFGFRRLRSAACSAEFLTSYLLGW